MIEMTKEPPRIRVMEFKRRLKLAKKQFAQVDDLINSRQLEKKAGQKKLLRLVAKLDENLWRGHLYYQPSGPKVRIQLLTLETILKAFNK